MTFFAVLAALLAEHLRPVPQRHTLVFGRVPRYLSHYLNAGKMQYGILAWCIVMFPLIFGTALIYVTLGRISLWLAWFWDIAVLYVCIRFKADVRTAKQIHLALARDDLSNARQLFGRWRGISLPVSDAGDLARLNLEALFTGTFQHLFGVIFWFGLLGAFGPVGAVFYRTSELLSRHWQIASDGVFATFSQQIYRLVNAAPARVTALSFAIAGNFEDAVFCWRSQSGNWTDANLGIVLASGAGALGVKLGLPLQQGGIDRPELGVGEGADNHYFASTLSLIWRALTIWLFFLLLVALAQLAR